MQKIRETKNYEPCSCQTNKIPRNLWIVFRQSLKFQFFSVKIRIDKKINLENRTEKFKESRFKKNSYLCSKIFHQILPFHLFPCQNKVFKYLFIFQLAIQTICIEQPFDTRTSLREKRKMTIFTRLDIGWDGLKSFQLDF